MISLALILPPLRNYWHLLLYAVGPRFAVRDGCCLEPVQCGCVIEGGGGGDAIMKMSRDYISGKLEGL